MSTILFRGIQLTPRMACVIIVSWLTFNTFELSYPATSNENHETTSTLEMTFTGTGTKTTRHFTVEDGWKLRWETDSPTFKLSAHGSARRPYSGPMTKREEVLRFFESMQPIVLANTNNPTGNAEHSFGGTFYLQIVASGEWSIHLKTVKDTKDYLDVPYTGAP